MRRNLILVVVLALASVSLFSGSVLAQTSDARVNVILGDPDRIEAIDFLEGSAVTVEVDDPSTALSPDWSDSGVAAVDPDDPSATLLVFEVAGYNVVAGAVITASDGTIAVTHNVIDLTVDDVDPNHDFVRGTAPPLAEVWVEADGAVRTETADVLGFWHADYSVPGGQEWEQDVRDIQFGSSGQASVFDTNGSSTTVLWELTPTIGWANTQWPPTMTHTISTVNRTPNVYGQVWIDGLTNLPGPAPGIVAQVGYGPDGVSPSDASWQWADAVFNVDVGNNDEYMGSLLPDTHGVFDYLYRYSTDDGATWLYADLDGPGTSNPGLLTVVSSGDLTPPAPVTLSEVSRSSSEIVIAWTASPDPDVAGYEVLRRPAGSPAPFAEIAELGTGALTYNDGTVSPGATYEYVVRVFDTSYNRSPDSNTVTISAASITPADLMEELIAQVESLNLHNGISNSLDAKLQNAVKALDDINENNNAAAIGKLEAFINEVEAQSGIHISEADAADLIATAQSIIDLLNS